LEKKRYGLKKDCRESQHDIIHLRRERELLQIDVDSFRREHGQLQDMSRLQKMENVELAE
jgi:hypothetical protein